MMKEKRSKGTLIVILETKEKKLTFKCVYYEDSKKSNNL